MQPLLPSAMTSVALDEIFCGSASIPVKPTHSCAAAGAGTHATHFILLQLALP